MSTRLSIVSDLYFRHFSRFFAFLAVVFWGLHSISYTIAQEKVSAFGTYKGYSEERYDGWKRFSQYVTMEDGTKLAIDVVRPTKNGELHEEKLPVVWAFNRYHRAYLRGGKAFSYVDFRSEMQHLIKHGYIVAMADVRGSGASFGVDRGVFSDIETQDGYEIMSWLASQSWSNGRLGMYGQSYLGIVQLFAAGTRHPALKAVFPALASFDLYDLIYTGGIYRKGFMDRWGALTIALDNTRDLPGTDEDTDGSLYNLARAQHKDNFAVAENMGRFPWRSSWDLPEATFNSPHKLLTEINDSGIPVYQWAGWLDIYAKDALLWWGNLKVPQKLTMGPWAHISSNREEATERNRLLTVEQHRWFDRWLKGIENGVGKEPGIQYATVVTPGVLTWHATDTWPPKGLKKVTYHLTREKELAKSKPAGKSGTVTAMADFSASVGSQSRWLNGAGAGPVDYTKLSANNEKGIVFSTDVLVADLTITGSAVLEGELSVNASDLDLHVYLQEVNAKGEVEFVGEGALRLSHAKEVKAPYVNFGLPYHSHDEHDQELLVKGKARRFRLDILPVSNVFNSGNRLQLVINFADRDNSDNRVWDQPVALTLSRMKINLPVMKNGATSAK